MNEQTQKFFRFIHESSESFGFQPFLSINNQSLPVAFGNQPVLDAFARDVQRWLAMKPLSNFVSLHPYFKVHPGKIEAFKTAFPAFVEKTAKEEKNLFYEFTLNGDEAFCREGYADADGLLAHLENIGALLAEALKIADLIRLEVHGPAAELDKLRGPLAHLDPAWFVTTSE